MKKYFLLCILALCSCANLGEKFSPQQPNSDEAIVYFYRPWKYVGGATSPDIQENGSKIITMYNGGYYPHHTTTGSHTYTVESLENTDSVTLDIHSGKEYYVSSGVNWGMISGRYNIKFVTDRNRALSEIQECKLITKKD